MIDRTEWRRVKHQVLLGGMLAVCWAAAIDAGEEAASAELKAKIERLVVELDAEERAARDEASASIIALGPAAIEFLPDPYSKSLTGEQQQRLRRIFGQLYEKRADADARGKEVSLGKEKVPLADALKSLEKQSGNIIVDKRNEQNQDLSNPSIVLPRERMPFWEAIDEVARQANGALYFHTDDKTLALVGRPSADPPIAYAGAFRFALERLVLQNDYRTRDSAPVCLAHIQLAFEPRLRPIMFEFDAEKTMAKDEQGRMHLSTGPAPGRLTVAPDEFTTQFILRLNAPPRNALALAELSSEIAVWLPSFQAKFVFEKLDGNDPEESSKHGIRVHRSPFKEDEGTWEITVSVERPEGQPMLDTHLLVALENEVYLEAPDGTRYTHNAGKNVNQRTLERSEVVYFFVDTPKMPTEYKLVVNVPADIRRVPVPFTFRDLRLP